MILDKILVFHLFMVSPTSHYLDHREPHILWKMLSSAILGYCWHKKVRAYRPQPFTAGLAEKAKKDYRRCQTNGPKKLSAYCAYGCPANFLVLPPLVAAPHFAEPNYTSYAFAHNRSLSHSCALSGKLISVSYTHLTLPTIYSV